VAGFADSGLNSCPRKRRSKIMSSMYDEILTQKRAHTIIDLAQVKKGDKVLLICDYTTAELGQLLASQAYNIDALPILTIIPILKGHSDSVP